MYYLKFSLGFLCLLLFTCCASNDSDEPSVEKAAPLIKSVSYYGHYKGDNPGEFHFEGTDYLNYDKEGRLVGSFGSTSISYTQKDQLLQAIVVDGDFKAELSVENNLCVLRNVTGDQGRDNTTTKNQYSDNKIISSETTGTSNFKETYQWEKGNLVSWCRIYPDNRQSQTNYEYYDYNNPWQNTLFDFTTASLLEDDWDDLPVEMMFGLIGTHSKNLIKAVYSGNMLYKTYEYEFDGEGRVTKILEKVDQKWENYKQQGIYELSY